MSAPASDLTAHVSLRMPAEVLSDLDRVATALDRPRSWVILRALRSYLEAEGAEVLDAAAGLAELERGEAADFDEVLAGLQEVVDRAERKTSSRR
jgi:predicted transcriptional regulator